MSDFNSSLPVRTEANGDVAAKIVDGTTPSQVLGVDSSGRITVKLDDSTGNALTSQVNGSQRALDVKDQANGPVAPGTAAALSELAGGQYNSTLPTLTNTQQAAVQLTSRGEMVTVMNIGAAPISGTNPVPVAMVSALVGASVNNYNTAAAVASGATSNHTYTITASKTFSGKKIWAAASGKLKIEVQVSADGSAFTSLWVGFNSTANPNISIDLDQLVFIESGTSSAIRIIRTNEDKQAMDVYSTISGTEA